MLLTNLEDPAPPRPTFEHTDSTMSSDNSLPSGTYVIHSVLAEDRKKEERLIMIADPDGSGDPVKTENDKLFKVWLSVLRFTKRRSSFNI